jgi:plasmid stability protein
MAKMVQIRHMPDPIHRILKSRAASAGMSLSDYLLRELRKIAERPTMDELIARMHKRPPVTVEIDSARLIREDRDAR